MRILEKLRGKSAPAKARAEYLPGARMYCIGDIHGRLDLLEELHARILADAAGFGGERQILYLGDYIDRGAQSKQVVDLLSEKPLKGFEAIFLKGNHEQALLDFLEYPQATASWLTFGGRETLHSYGVTTPLIPTLRDVDVLAAKLDTRLPVAHRAFYQDGLLYWAGGCYYFVHAGIRPGVALDKQHYEDQLWIREEFTASSAEHGAVVVHGHSITPQVEFRPNRIGIDTGAFATGVLTALVLEGTRQRLLQTGSKNEP